MTEKQKLDITQEILLTMIAILFFRVIMLFMLDFTSIADYLCRAYENQYYDKYVYAEGKINEYVLDETSKLITQGNVPQSLVHFFYEMGGMVYVTDKDLTLMCDKKTEENQRRTIGFFRYKGNEYSIYFSDELSSTTCAYEHEFGHYLDYLFGWYSESDNFEKIFNEEKESFQKYISDNEHYKTQDEYFAQCYSLYLTDEEILKRYCPKTHEVIELLSNEVERCYTVFSP